jgi:GntR family phosphonate transport system transcriptional regulator
MTKFLALGAHINLLPEPIYSFWARVAHEIACAIGKDIYAPGERLPSEHELAEIHGVDRHTIYRSLSSLGRMGLVRSAKGSGTFMEELAVDLVMSKRTWHKQALTKAGLKGGLQLLRSYRERADAGNAQALHVSDRYFPLPRFAGLDIHIQETGSITQSFTRLGVADYTRQQSRISACLPRTEIADHLSQASTRPVLQVTSVNVDTSGVPIEYARRWFAEDRVTLTVEYAYAA